MLGLSPRRLRAEFHLPPPMSDDDSTSANSLEEQIAQSELEILEAKRRIAEIRLKKQISSRNNSVLSASNKSLSRSSGSKSGSSVNGSKSSQSTTSASPANGSSRSHGSQITVPEGPKPSASPTGSTKAVQDAVPDWADADAGEQVTLTVAAKEHWKDEPFKRFDVRYTKGVPATLQTVWSAFAQGKQAGERTDTWRVFVNGKVRRSCMRVTNVTFMPDTMNHTLAHHTTCSFRKKFEDCSVTLTNNALDCVSLLIRSLRSALGVPTSTKARQW